MKIRPRHKTKLPKLVEIVPDIYSDLCDMSCKPLKISEKLVQLSAIFEDLFIIYYIIYF